MIGLLTVLLGRLPIGLLQLTHNPARMLAAIAGVAFADVLVLVQLGLAGSMSTSVDTPYRLFKPDCLLLSAHDSETIADSSTLPRQRLYQALAHPQVVGGILLHIGQVKWIPEGGSSASLLFFGIEPDAPGFVRDDMAGPLSSLSIEDSALVDLQTRFLEMSPYEISGPASPVAFELQGRQLSAIGTVSMGGGFAGDGIFLVSDQTFLRLFPSRSSSAPSHILLAVDPTADISRVAAELAEVLPAGTVQVRTVAEASTSEQKYQMTARPTGLIFAFGVVIGIVVGIVIAYQVLSTDVADHLREYATFRAMGYRTRFFAGIVLEEALVLAGIGFWPGLLLSHLFYEALVDLAGVPIHMTTQRAVAVFLGTVVACSISGLLAMRRLTGADPADLF